MSDDGVFERTEAVTGRLTARSVKRISAMSDTRFARVVNDLREQFWTSDFDMTLFKRVPARDGIEDASLFVPHLGNWTFRNVLLDHIPAGERTWGASFGPREGRENLLVPLLYADAVAIEDPVVQVVGGYPFWSSDQKEEPSPPYGVIQREHFGPLTIEKAARRRDTVIAALSFLARHRPLIVSGRLELIPLVRSYWLFTPNPKNSDDQHEGEWNRFIAADLLRWAGRSKEAAVYESATGFWQLPTDLHTEALEELRAFLYHRWDLGRTVAFNPVTPMQRAVFRYLTRHPLVEYLEVGPHSQRLGALATVQMPRVGDLPAEDLNEILSDEALRSDIRRAFANSADRIASRHEESDDRRFGEWARLVIAEEVEEAVQRFTFAVSAKTGPYRAGLQRFAVNLVTGASSVGVTAATKDPLLGVLSGAAAGGATQTIWTLSKKLSRPARRKAIKKLLLTLRRGT